MLHIYWCSSGSIFFMEKKLKITDKESPWHYFAYKTIIIRVKVERFINKEDVSIMWVMKLFISHGSHVYSLIF
jgi:hypothetical protein